LFEHFAPRIKAWLIRTGSGPQQAEELAQEAMLAAWRKAALFDPARASAATWIFTIARNLRIDAIRRERHPGFDPAGLILLPEDSVAVGAELETEQKARAVRHALGALPDEQSRVIIMSFFSDKPHSQIAVELGIPLGTVKSRIRLAMLRLKSLLENAP
jgi:RNA polymerase sigma-70 factor (ECF subfamily)